MESVPSELPELGDLIPKAQGSVYEWDGCYWVGVEQVNHATGEYLPEKGLGSKGDLVRVGFKLYEIVGFESSYRSYRLRPFSATLTPTQLMRLSGQAHNRG